MAYRLQISKAAQDDLKKLDKSAQQAVADRARKLVENVDQMRHLALKGKFAGLYKIRVHGKYRIIYQLQRDEQVIVVVRVGNRNDIDKE